MANAAIGLAAINLSTNGPWPIDTYPRPFTLEIWTKPATATTFFFLSPAFTGAQSLEITSAGQLIPQIAENTVCQVPSTYLFDGNWHHFALASDQNGNWGVYYDGIPLNISGAGGFVFGSGLFDSPASILLPPGYSAELRLWNVIRSPAQILETMNTALSGTESGLVGLWNFADQTLVDATGTFSTGGSVNTQSSDLPAFLSESVAERTSARLSDRVSTAALTVQHAPPGDGETDIANILLMDFLSGAISEGESIAVTQLLSLFSGSSDEKQEILNELNLIEAQVAQLLADLQNDTNKIINTVDWNTLVNQLQQPVADIKTQFLALQSGLTSNSQLASYVNVNTDLTEIAQAILPGGVNPESPGLLSDLVAMLLPPALQAQQQASIPRFDLADLITAYNAIEQYFHYLLGEQVKAITIVTNAVVYQKADPSAFITAFSGYVKQECAAFLTAVEQLVVGYCGDLTLLGMMTGPAMTTNPLYLADTYAAQRLMPNSYTFVRVWGGSGNGSFPFATSSSFNGSAPSIQLVASGGTGAPAIAADTDLSTAGLITFPANANSQWSLYRGAFALPSPPSGQSYVWQPDPFPNPGFYNCWIAPSAYGERPFDQNAPQIGIGASGASPPSVALIDTNAFSGF